MFARRRNENVEHRLGFGDELRIERPPALPRRAGENFEEPVPWHHPGPDQIADPDQCAARRAEMLAFLVGNAIGPRGLFEPAGQFAQGSGQPVAVEFSCVLRHQLIVLPRAESKLHPGNGVVRLAGAATGNFPHKPNVL